MAFGAGRDDRPRFCRILGRKARIIAWWLSVLNNLSYLCSHNRITTNDMKAKLALYNEVEQPIEPLNEQKLAIAGDRPEPVDVPKQGLYIVDYKTLVKPTLIALLILVVWAIATWLL